MQSLPYPSISTERGVYQFGSAHDSQSVQGIFDHAPLVERRTNGTLAKANEFEAAHSYVASYPKSSRLDVPLDSSPISTDSSARDPSSQRSSVTTVSGPDWQSKGSREDLSFYENSNSVHNQPNSAQAEDISHLSSEAEKDPIVKSYSSEDPFELFTNESPIADSVTLENSFAAIGPKLAQSQENTLSSAQYQIRSSSISSLVDHPTARGITSRAPVSLTYLEAEELRKATKQDRKSDRRWSCIKATAYSKFCTQTNFGGAKKVLSSLYHRFLRKIFLVETTAVKHPSYHERNLLKE